MISHLISFYIYVTFGHWEHGAADPGPCAPSHLIFRRLFPRAGEGGADGAAGAAGALADFSSSLGFERGTCRIKCSNSGGSNLS